MKELTGELRWIENKDKALERRILVEARRMEDVFYKHLKNKAPKREQQPPPTNQMSQRPDEATTTTIDTRELTYEVEAGPRQNMVHQASQKLNAMEQTVEDALDERKVGVLNLRLLHKRGRGQNPKYKAEVINYKHLKTSNLGYPIHKGGMVEEWTTEEQQNTTTTTTKPMLEGGGHTHRRIARPRRRILEQTVELDQMEMEVGHGSQMRVGATTTTPMDTNDEDDLTGSMSYTLMEGAIGNGGAEDGGGRKKRIKESKST